MNRISLVALLASSISFAAPALAQGGDEGTEAAESTPAITVTGGLTFATQYRFRGISLSDEDAAAQGTLNLNHESGLYAGVWGSSLDGFGELGGSNLELDLYAGYRHQVGDGVTIDGGLLYYAYPGSSGGDFEFFEPYANVSAVFGPVTAKIGGNFAPAQDALADKSNIYIYGELSAAIPGTPVTLTSHLGMSDGETPLTPSGNYVDWSLGATVTWQHLTAGIAYVDTDLSGAEAASGGATKDIVDAAVVATLTASF
jgi:uncharacterized protein (TIGR02001 family)